MYCRVSVAWADFIKMYIGIGILLLPNAFAQGGLLVTSVFVIFITLTFTHGMLLVVSPKKLYAHHQKDTIHFVPNTSNAVADRHIGQDKTNYE